MNDCKKICPECNGDGYVTGTHYEPECCGNWDKYGGCCGNPASIPQPHQEQCCLCEATGYLKANK